MENETIMIDGVRYYADRPNSCRGCFFWKNRKAGLLPGGVSEKDITLCGLLLRSLCQFLYEEMCKRSLWDEDGGAGQCVRKMI